MPEPSSAGPMLDGEYPEYLGGTYIYAPDSVHDHYSLEW